MKKCKTCTYFTKVKNPWSDSLMPIGYCGYYSKISKKPFWAVMHQVEENDGQGCTVWEFISKLN